MSGYFGIGIYQPKTIHNVGGLWRSAHNFGAAFIFTVGHRYKVQAADTTKAHRSIPLYEYSSFAEMRALLPKECLLIGIEQCEGAAQLPKVAHPHRAVYLLGAEDYGLPADVLAACHRVMEIPSARCLNVAVAGSIVIYDRLLKGTSEFRTARELRIEGALP